MTEPAPTRKERIAELRAELAALPRDTLPVGTPDHIKAERSIQKETLLLKIWELEETP